MKKIKEKLIKIKFFLIWDGVKRAEFLKKHKILYSIGENCLFQSRNFPMDPKLIKFHNNVSVAAGSVVTKSVPENSIVAGVPAKVIGKFDVLERDREDNDSYLLNKNYDEIIDISWNNFNKNKGETI